MTKYNSVSEPETLIDTTISSDTCDYFDTVNTNA